MRIGAQMYTLRSHCQSLDGLSDALRRVADIGYRYVQLSGSCSFPAEWMRDQLRRFDLTCVLTHTPPARLEHETDAVLAEHQVLGCSRIGIGWWPHHPEGEGSFDDFVSRFTPVAEAFRRHGALLMYHNHDQEFQHLDGLPILQRLAERFDPDAMGFTLDTFWVQAGGGDPAAWLDRLSGRVPCIHLKDFAYGRKMAVLGEGNLNFDRILASADRAGTETLLVEQDDCYGEDPFDCLARSYRYLRARGLS